MFLVLDAIDECALERRGKLLHFIIRLTTELSRVKIFVTSRREQDIEQAFLSKSVPTIQIKAESVNEDIKKFIHSQVDSLMEKGMLKVKNPQLKTTIIDTLTYQSDGM